MSKIAIAIVLSLIAGIAVGVWVIDESPQEGAGNDAPLSIGADESASLHERLRTLERVVAEERAAREVLEEQLLMIFEQIDEPRPETAPPRDAEAVAATTTSAALVENRGRQRDRVAMMRRFHERRVAGLVESGYSPEEAERLIQIESETQFEVMQEVYEAQRNGESVNFFSGALNTQSRLREKLGDAEYERFLVAQGERTNVQVTSVLDGSPGSDAGLRPGDEIVSYNGRRTFSMTELRELTMGGEPGEDIVVEIDRDGVRMQLSIPRGPIGMNGNGASVRSRNWWGG